MKRKTWVKLGCLVLLLPPALLAYTFVEPHWLVVNNETYESADLPDAFDGYRIVFISDIHHGPYFSLERVTRLVKRVNALEPDLILMGGDYVHRDPKYIRPAFGEFADLVASDGVYGVLGNHDHWEGAAQTRNAMKEAGIGEIDNTGLWITRGTQRIRIGGVGDVYEDTQDLEAAYGEAQTDDFVIVVCHEPDVAEELTDDRMDLLLSGHTHGGQVTLFGFWAPVLPTRYGNKYRSGWVSAEHTDVYVTKGVGTITPPVRFFCRPEIVVLKLRSKSS